MHSNRPAIVMLRAYIYVPVCVCSFPLVLFFERFNCLPFTWRVQVERPQNTHTRTHTRRSWYLCKMCAMCAMCTYLQTFNRVWMKCYLSICVYKIALMQYTHIYFQLAVIQFQYTICRWINTHTHTTRIRIHGRVSKGIHAYTYVHTAHSSLSTGKFYPNM